MRMEVNSASILNETYAFRVFITKAIIQDEHSQGGTCWYPKTGPVTFNHGLLANVENYFQLNVNPEIGVMEMYHSANLDKALKNTDQPHVTWMKLTILTDGVVEAEGMFSRDYLKVDVTSSTGQQYQSRSKLEVVSVLGLLYTLGSKWSASANELKVEIAISKPKEAVFLESQIQEFNFIPESSRKPKLIDFSNLYLSSEFSDVTIHCEAEIFPAHVLILSLNSPVFAKMFEHQMKESTEKCVEIKDVSPDAVREMLRYFYTGHVENFPSIGATLYELGDKYLVEDLKSLCAWSMVKHVNRDNAFEMYCFGREKEIPDLTEKAEQMLIANKGEIIKNLADFQDLLQGIPSLVAEELFQLLVHKN